MKLSLLAFLSVATASHHRQRQTSEGCCFHLESVGVVTDTVQEDNTGNLILAGTFQQGGFCLDSNTNSIQDSRGNNCFMRAPNYQFECFRGVPSTSVFDIVSATENGKTKLVYDDNDIYLACPMSDGDDAAYEIYSKDKSDTTGCLEVTLVLADETEECAASGMTYGSGSGVEPRATQSVLGAGCTTTAAPVAGSCGPVPSASTSVPSQTCSVDYSAPSIAPRKIGYPDDNRIHSTSDSASITSQNSTSFEYTIPRSFATTPSQLCALQFRLPVCNSLPEGYPCYIFSGIEQEVVASSGMVFSLVEDNGKMEWDSTALQQVFPDKNTTLGTFECDTDAATHDGDRHISWLASSVRDFFLQYKQAGIGPDAEFADGIGAWIVQCS